MLYLVATPIGNLEDITLRALRTLKEADYILAEDTRRTAGLLHHYEITKKLISFHMFNEKRTEERILSDLREGKNIALVSDAGMPTIADPGTFLVQKCLLENLPVTAIPGPSALLTAFSLSGLSCEQFQFLGFFPKKSGEIQKKINEAENYPGVTLFFETPHSLVKNLKRFKKTTRITVARELTKLHEEVIQNTAENLIFHFEVKPVKGEIVLLVEGKASEFTFSEPFEKELMTLLEEVISHNEAAKILGKLTKKGKKCFY